MGADARLERLRGRDRGEGDCGGRETAAGGRQGKPLKNTPPPKKKDGRNRPPLKCEDAIDYSHMMNAGLSK